jgi:hypothetical protein
MIVGIGQTTQCSETSRQRQNNASNVARRATDCRPFSGSSGSSSTISRPRSIVRSETHGLATASPEVDAERAGQRIDDAAAVGSLVRAIAAAARFERLPPKAGAPPTNARQLCAALGGVGETFHQTQRDGCAPTAEVRPWFPERNLSTNERGPADPDLGCEAGVVLRSASLVVRAQPRWRAIPTPLDLPAHRCIILQHPAEGETQISPPAPE